MSHLVVIPGAVASKLITTMELCARLRSTGHRVTMLAPSKSGLAPDGVDRIHFDLEVPRAPRQVRGGGPIARASSRWHAWRSTTERREAAVASMDARGFQAIVASLAPDLLLIDIEAHAYTIAAARTGVRTAIVNVFFNLYKRPRAPPLHVPITPGVGLAGSRLGIELAWLRFRSWQLRGRLRSRLDGSDFLAVLEAYAAREGYRLAHHVDRYQALLPFVYPHLPMLTLNLLELELPGVRRAGSYYVGPMVNLDRTGVGFAEDEVPVVRELSKLTEEIRASEGRRKLIYCTFGSYYMGDDSAFLRRLAEAVAARPQWTAVVALGGRMKPEALEPLPANVRAYRWVPQMQVLASADCAVVHGGMTSVYESVHCEVPMVVFPFSEIFDQHGTACRVRYHGLGIVGDRTEDSPATIRGYIERALTDQAMRDRVIQMRQHMQRYRHEQRLARAVEAILADGAGGERNR